ncbi:GNAT family N-acetyltransferase [Glycomyces albidus]|uniref:GNAT family N-acetyltransferase n=1 Tax=Glycomyces albidus TaxID=2656774 RepID=A0A6L5G6P6_9ACTN|nr:GNAT family N-acetyltransferase [Glycomyces albidus]MQM25315.1 GNAT family N-acetyltransferase [Glycomyces albidus]
MLGPEHVGRRVAVRIRLADPAPGRRFTDITGELVAAGPEWRVLTAAGTEVTVSPDTVVAARVIPPKPTPFSEIIATERLLSDTWPAIETEPLGGWLLRAAGGFTNRANSVLALTAPEGGTDAAVAAVEAWYAARGLPAKFSMAGPVTRRLDDELAARGWEAELETSVMTKALNVIGAGAVEPGESGNSAVGEGRVVGGTVGGGTFGEGTVEEHAAERGAAAEGTAEEGTAGNGAAAAGAAGLAGRVVLSDAPSAAFLEQTGRGAPEIAERVCGSGPGRAYAEIRRGGELVARGRGAIAGDLMAVTNVATDLRLRRQGLASAILAALEAWGAANGAARAALQVEAVNAPAVAMYGRLGYAERYRYCYRVRT